MKTTIRRAVLAAALLLALPLPARAHRQWLYPSATVLSGADAWVTFDAAISNDLFYFEHRPLRLENLVVTGPDGAAVKAENLATGRYRSTFDVPLAQKGTYRIAIASALVSASYEVNGEAKSFRGTSEAFAKEVPADAKGLVVSRTANRVEAFVTSGSPTDAALKPTGSGLELAPVTHPNDLVAGADATFGFVLDGKPAAGLAVSLIPGGIRYRDNLGEVKATTDAEGRVTFKLPAAGMYWMNATFQEGETGRGPGGPQVGAPPTGGAAGGPPANRPVRPGRRASYVATLEVLAE